MTQATNPVLEPGRVYRTRDFAAWSTNPPRLVHRLVRTGQLVPLERGLYMRPISSRFGPAPASDSEIMRAFLDGAPFVFTGPPRWNPLGLGTTAQFAHPLVYNTKRSGLFTLGGRSFLLRRTAFPERPTPEWFVVDLLEHADEANASRERVAAALGEALARGSFDAKALAPLAERYGSKRTKLLLRPLLSGAIH